MELQFHFSESMPKYIAIYEQLKEKIINKQIRANEKLPSKRKLAEQLNVSIQTVQYAYEQLLSEGYIYSVERSGYFISEYSGATGNYAKHIEKMRTLYKKKRKILIDALKTYLPDEFKIFGDTAGLHVVIQLPSWLEEKRAIQIALENGIAIDPVSTCYQTSSPKNLVMVGFGAIPIQNIHVAIQTLAKCWLQSN